MFTPLVALSDQEITIDGAGSLVTRPMDFFDEILPKLDVKIHKLDISIHRELETIKQQLQNVAGFGKKIERRSRSIVGISKKIAA